MSSKTFRSIYGEVTLLRRPVTPHLPLQAWDAADEYLLAEAHAKNTATKPKVLAINDQFGALATAFSQTDLCSWGDSYTAHRATLDNFARNQLDVSRLELLPSTQIPLQNFDLVLWRIPKTLALFQQQLRILPTYITDATWVFAGAMQKHLAPSTRELLQQIGEVDVLPAQKKARIFSLRPRRDKPDVTLTNTSTSNNTAADESALVVKEYGLQLKAGPNVFARDNFDIGARFFIEQFDKLPRAQRIADLGCGNGILGIIAKQKLSTAQITFFDESYQAVAAAEKNYALNGFEKLPPAAKFHIDDVFTNYTEAPFDLILCNPPFHQGHVIGNHIALQMFIQSKRHLRSGGELWIVGNRHLEYHLKLKKIFGNCRQIAANAKFVVLAAHN